MKPNKQTKNNNLNSEKFGVSSLDIYILKSM